MLRAAICLRLRLPQNPLRVPPQLSTRLLPFGNDWLLSQAHRRPVTPLFSRAFSISSQRCSIDDKPPSQKPQKPTIRENIYTVPNLLTVSRIFACPVLGWSILNDNFYLATGLLAYAGLTDLVRFSAHLSTHVDDFRH
jgi:cardiolipin synthase